MTWEKAQSYELDWHNSCVNSFHEEQKQLVYARKMGLEFTPTPKTPHNIDLDQKSILDIGSGPYSLLLKAVNFTDSWVIDPLMDKFPQWVRDRYKIHGLQMSSKPGEEISTNKQRDEVWIYNVLEHVKDPEQIIKNAKKAGKIIRIFEWLDTPPSVGHPQTLRRKKLDLWLGGEGKIEEIKRGGATGKAYYGIFKGENYG